MGEANPQVVVIAGPNGAGKSTLAPAILRDYLPLADTWVVYDNSGAASPPLIASG